MCTRPSTPIDELYIILRTFIHLFVHVQIIAIDLGHNLDGTMGHNNDLEELDKGAEWTNDNVNNKKRRQN